MKRTKSQIAKELRDHLDMDGCLNDGTTDDLYREWFGITDGRDTDLETVEQWAFDVANRTSPK